PDARLICKSEECLVDERRRIQRVALALPLELPMRNRTQLGIDERNDPIPCDGIVAPPKDFEIGGLGLLTHRFRPLRTCDGGAHADRRLVRFFERASHLPTW